MNRRALLASLGAGVAGLAGCTGGPATETPASDTDAGTPSDTPTRTPAPTPDSARVAANWDTFLPGRYTLAAPAVSDERLFIGTETSLYALAVGDGSEAWTGALGALAHNFTPALSDGGVVAAARDAVGGTVVSDAPGVVAAFSREGAERWRVNGPVTAGPLVHDGLAHFVTTTEERVRLHAHSLADGSEAWTADVGGAGEKGFAAPVALDGRIVATVTRTRSDGTQFARFVAVEDGERAWTATTESEVEAAPSVAPGRSRLYAGTESGRVHALRPDGSTAWSVETGDDVAVSPAVAGDGVHVMSGSDLVSLAADGSQRWRVEVADPRRTGLTVADGRTYVGGEKLSAVTRDGTVDWSFNLGGIAGAFGAPVVQGGKVYTGACIKQEGNDPYDHHVYELDG